MHKRRHPRFVRPSGRIKRVGEAWRRPRGVDSKQRVGFKYAGSKPGIGFRRQKSVRGTHPSGLVEELVRRPEDVKAVGAKAVRIASGVGEKKALEIRRVAKELGVRVLN